MNIDEGYYSPSKQSPSKKKSSSSSKKSKSKGKAMQITPTKQSGQGLETNNIQLNNNFNLDME